MTTLLHLDSSALGDASITRQLTAAAVAALRTPTTQVLHRDLGVQPLPHWSPAEAGSALSAEVLAEFQAADVLVLGVPMYNFGVPSAFKAWIDHIAVAGQTFRYTAAGPEGLAGGKRVILVSARGGRYAELPALDFQEAYVRQVLGFLGIGAEAITVVRAEGLAMEPAAAQQAVAEALGQVQDLVQRPMPVESLAVA